MTTKELIVATNKTTDLIKLYANCKGVEYSRARYLIKKKIYAIELPIIQNKLKQISDFDAILKQADDAYAYINTFNTLLDTSKLSRKRLNKTSLYNRVKRLHLKMLFNCLKTTNKYYFGVEKLIISLDPINRKHFEKLTGVDLCIFFTLEEIKKKSSK